MRVLNIAVVLVLLGASCTVSLAYNANEHKSGKVGDSDTFSKAQAKYLSDIVSLKNNFSNDYFSSEQNVEDYCTSKSSGTSSSKASLGNGYSFYASQKISSGSTIDEQYVGIITPSKSKIQFGQFASPFSEAMACTDVVGTYSGMAQQGNNDVRAKQITYQSKLFGGSFKVGAQLPSNKVRVDGIYYNNGSNNVADIDFGFSATTDYTFKNFVLAPLKVQLGYEYLQLNEGRKNNILTNSISVVRNGVSSSVTARNQLRSVRSYGASISMGSNNSLHGLFTSFSYEIREFNYGNGILGDGSNDYYNLSHSLQSFEYALTYMVDNVLSMGTGYAHMNLNFKHGAKSNMCMRKVPVYFNIKPSENFKITGEACFDAGSDDALSDLASGAPVEDEFKITAQYVF
ncbi:MAG TPA: hypothetical protein DCR21_04770 [Succinivibrionaceae bacterium]|nr:hypothetical protein [Succinivibrionaceae bacterium]